MRERYTEELRRDIMAQALRASIDENLCIIDLAHKVAMGHNRPESWGAISDRIRNFIYLLTGGARGRLPQYSTKWVKEMYEEELV